MKKTIRLKARNQGMTLIQYAKSKGIDINVCGVRGAVSKEDEKELKKLVDELASGEAVMVLPLNKKWKLGDPCPYDTDGDGNCGRIACPYCGVNCDRTS